MVGLYQDGAEKSRRMMPAGYASVLIAYITRSIEIRIPSSPGRRVILNTDLEYDRNKSVEDSSFLALLLLFLWFFGFRLWVDLIPCLVRHFDVLFVRDRAIDESFTQFGTADHQSTEIDSLVCFEFNYCM